MLPRSVPPWKMSLRPSSKFRSFDKILKTTDIQGSGTEHNEAFFEIDTKKLTKVGKEQKELIQLVVQYWYDNYDEMPSVTNLLKQVSKGTDL